MGFVSYYKEESTEMKRFLALSLVFLFTLAITACGADTTDSAEEQAPPAVNVNEVSVEPIEEPVEDGDNGWVIIADFEFTFSEGETQVSSDTFELSGGEVRIIYEVVATGVGGNALFYLLPEGATLSRDADGNLSIAVQDITAIGSRAGEHIIEREAGMHYLLVNTSSVETVWVTIETRE